MELIFSVTRDQIVTDYNLILKMNPRPMLYTAMPDMDADETLCPMTSIDEYNGILPLFDLNIYPNPVCDKSYIEINILIANYVELSIFDFTGKKVQKLASENLQTGNQTFEWKANGLPAGIYFLRLETNGFSKTKKLLKLE